MCPKPCLSIAPAQLCFHPDDNDDIDVVVVVGLIVDRESWS